MLRGVKVFPNSSIKNGTDIHYNNHFICEKNILSICTKLKISIILALTSFLIHSQWFLTCVVKFRNKRCIIVLRINTQSAFYLVMRNISANKRHIFDYHQVRKLPISTSQKKKRNKLSRVHIGCKVFDTSAIQNQITIWSNPYYPKLFKDIVLA